MLSIRNIKYNATYVILNSLLVTFKKKKWGILVFNILFNNPNYDFNV